MKKEFTAKFKVDKIVEEVIYPYNIKYQKIKGLTKTNYEGTVAGNKFGEASISNEMIDKNKYYTQNIVALTIPYNKDLKFKQVFKNNNSAWEREHLDILAQTYEQETGENIIAIINDDFFDISCIFPFPGQPDGIVIQNQNNYKTKSYGDYMSGNLGVDINNNFVSFSLEESNNLFTNLPQIDIFKNKSFTINSVNQKPKQGEIALYFGLPNKDHKVEPKVINPEGKLYAVKGLILPNGENDFYGKGKIIKTKENILKEDIFFLDSLSQEFDNLIENNTIVRVQYNLKEEYKKYYAFFGYKGIILENGEFSKQMEGNFRIRHPRTMIGIKENKDVVLVVVDGRKPEQGSYGVNGAEMAEIMKYFNCVQAYNFDGGGSSALFVKNEKGKLELKNKPCEGQRKVINGLAITTKNIT